MEISKKNIEKLIQELDKRSEELKKQIRGVEFSDNKKETPWLHTMDSERRRDNRYVDNLKLSLAISDFNSILQEFKKLK